MIEQSLYSALTNDSTVSALVSTRIYPVIAPQSAALPMIVYQRVSTVPVTSIDGDSGLDSVRMQVSCWAKTYAETKSLAAAVRSAVMANLIGVTDSELDDYDAETRSFRVIIDFVVWQK
jgi:hypothetical protein